MEVQHGPLRGTALKLRYIYGGVIHYRPGDRIELRVLPDFELVLLIEGQATYSADGVARQVPPGGAILARPGVQEAYRWDTNGPTRHAYVHFDIETLPSRWPPPDEWPGVLNCPAPVVAPMFRHLLERVAAHPEWPAMNPDAATCGFLESMIEILIGPAGETPPSAGQRFTEPVHRALNLMREILDSDPHRNVRLEDLARCANVTEKHLCKLFQNALGHPPMKTFRLMKLQLAIALLRRSDLAIKEIANRCGFDNPLYFTRCFTDTYGSAPSATRRALLRQEPPPRQPLPPEITPRIYW